ncbi:MAG: CDP-diacylglycerol--glycerol-3-phosphate 3-phosphatidyltransferase [Mycoplasmoidaceae bacterium]
MNCKIIPNILTIFRIILVFFIIFFIFFKIDVTLYCYDFFHLSLKFDLNLILAGIFFIIASLSDALDGYLARKYQWISEFGKIWDPIADKVLINSVLIAFAIKCYIPYFMPILFIMRDVIVDAFRMSAIKKEIDVSANLFGKLKTIFQMLALTLIFFVFNDSLINMNYYLSENWFYYIIQNGLVFVALCFSFWSGYIYIHKTFKKSL